jgi:hypothetical protein
MPERKPSKYNRERKPSKYNGERKPLRKAQHHDHPLFENNPIKVILFW